MKETIALVLGGGQGSRLYPLTKFRAKPAVPLAGNYRLIDIPLSNCINSGINRIYVLTQFMSFSLHRHIRQTYRFDSFSDGFVELLAAQQTMDAGTDWYQGTADAVRKNLRYLEQPGIKNVMILSGDQLYRMDLAAMMRTHAESNADVSIAAMPVDRADAASLGIMKADSSGRVTRFVEKPSTSEELEPVITPAEWLTAQGLDPKGRDCLASMGIYIFKRELLLELLRTTEYEDFGREVFPQSIDSRHVQMHVFDGYWEDIGTIRAFYEANLAMIQPDAPYKLVFPEAPVYSRARFLPPSHIGQATLHDCLIADGCVIDDGAVIENSVIGLRCRIGRDTVIRNSVVMGADYYETQLERKDDSDEGIPEIGIGSGCVIEGAILDKNCRIGNDVQIVNTTGIQVSDEDDRCMIRDGIPIVVSGASLEDGYQLRCQ